MLCKGLIAPNGMLPSAYVAERANARAVACVGGPGHAADALACGASLVVGCEDPIFAAQVARVFKDAGFDAATTTDVAGVELAGTAKNAAALAAAVAGVSGPNAAGAAAGKVFAEVDAFSRRRGGHEETFAGLAGAGDLVATVVAEGSRNRRAGELLGQGVPAASIGDELGQSSEALDGVGLLAATMRREGVPVADDRPPRRARRRAHRRRRLHRRRDRSGRALAPPARAAAPLAAAASGATDRGTGPG